MASMFDPSGMYSAGIPTAVTSALQGQQRRPQLKQNFGIPAGNDSQRLQLPTGYNTPAPATQQPMQTPAAQQGLGAFGGKLEGFDWNKMNSGHNSPKYQFGRVMSQFDPKGGITQGMLDQLNQLGLGTVSGKIGGDKISIGGSVDPRFQGITEFDIIRDLENGGGWQWGAITGGIGGGNRVPRQGSSAVMQALGGGHPAYAPGFAGNAPYAASSWLSDLLRSLGVSL